MKVDSALRRRAQTTGKSINQVAVEALTLGVGEQLQVLHDDLDFLVGSLRPAEALALEREITAQRIIDEKLWR
jgi:hypothetical protein